MLGRRVMPIMHEISHLPGGHKPLNFVHKLADGSTRHVQTYAGPIEIYGDKLMLCIVHDITEQKRLEEQLEHAAHHDAMTGLLNRRQFLSHYRARPNAAPRHRSGLQLIAHRHRSF